MSAAPAAPEPHIDGWPLYSGLPPAAPAAEPVCRSDGRCQYAIDSGAEGLGYCPKGKCIMPATPGATPAQSREPLTEEQVTAAARALNKRIAESCGLDEADMWGLQADLMKDDARVVLQAAHGIGSQP